MGWLKYPNFQVAENQLILPGPHATRIQALPENIWRILTWHRPEDQAKSSWVVQSLSVQPLAVVQENAEKLTLNPQSDWPLLLQLQPFQWQFGPQYSRFIAPRHQTLRPPGKQKERLAHDLPLEHSDGLPTGEGYSLHLDLEGADYCYGLGERTGFLNKKGRIWHNWTTDEFFHTPLKDPLYQAHPFLLMQRDGVYWGLYLDESWYTRFDLGYTSSDCLQIDTAGPTFDLYLIPGPKPADVLQRFQKLTGASPMPPLWALGYHQCRWGYPNQESAEAIARSYQAHQLPLSALWLDIDYMESYKVFSFSPHRFPQPEKLIQELAARQIRVITIVDPGVKKELGYGTYERGHAQKVFIMDHEDNELVGEVWPKPVVWPDFVRKDVREWWKAEMPFYLEKGVAGIWIDMNEPAAFNWPDKTLPLSARQGRYTHAEVHNLYGTMMAKATYEALVEQRPDKRPFVLTRSGFSGIQKYAWVWTGDNSSYWEHLETSLPMLMNLGLSGVPFVGSDIGGFSGDCEGELLARWTWAGVFSAFMRNHAGKGSRRQEPWQFGEPYLSAIRAALTFRYQLLPYLYTLAHQAHLEGLPPLRPLLLEYPKDPHTWALSDQFMLGSDLLVAPLLRPQQNHRLVYLPAGRWQNFWSGEWHEGENWLPVQAELNSIPLFQRAGSALPLQSEIQAESATWPGLYWRVAASESLSGAVYCDVGDGPEPGTMLYLTGHGTELELECSLSAQHACQIEILKAKDDCQRWEYAGHGILKIELAEKSFISKTQTNP